MSDEMTPIEKARAALAKKKEQQKATQPDLSASKDTSNTSDLPVVQPIPLATLQDATECASYFAKVCIELGAQLTLASKQHNGSHWTDAIDLVARARRTVTAATGGV